MKEETLEQMHKRHEKEMYSLGMRRGVEKVVDDLKRLKRFSCSARIGMENQQVKDELHIKAKDVDIIIDIYDI